MATFEQTLTITAASVDEWPHVQDFADALTDVTVTEHPDTLTITITANSIQQLP